MFDPYAESLSSTGEPPTAPSNSNRNDMSSVQTISRGNMDQQLSVSSSSSRSLSVQEPDSGYEASPSSIADNQRFFGEQSVAAAGTSEVRNSCTVNSDEEFDIIECHSQILFSDSESELDDYDTCLDGSSSLVSCSCCRTDSSNTNATAMSNCDNSRCNSSNSFNRPSSQPIQIPNLPSCNSRSDTNPQFMIESTIDLCPLTRSQPVDFSPLQRLGFIPEHHTLSWPCTASPFRNYRNVALSPPRRNITNRDIPNTNICRRHNHPVRSRRQIIDSEASSYSSSDDEGPEDVFNMPSGEASSYPTVMTMGSVPLPDVVLESTDSGRRSRSRSINLPPNREQVLNDIGQTLRRMSDLFVQRRQLRMAVMRARSRTASECDDIHRNGLS